MNETNNTTHHALPKCSTSSRNTTQLRPMEPKMADNDQLSVSHRGTITTAVTMACTLLGDISPVKLGKINKINQKSGISNSSQTATYLLPTEQRASEKQTKVFGEH